MRQLIRGRTLSFHADPAEVENAFTYHEDGAVITENGKIAAIGDYASLRDPALPEIDHLPHLILPGFIDTHIHFPQVQVIASWGAQLLDWLNTYTFPEESRFAQQGHAPLMAEKFLDLLLSHGTTTAVAFCSVHPQSAEALFQAAEARGMAMVAGKVMMDRNAPEAVLDTPQQGYDDSKRLIETWHGRGRLRYAITPRFAITSTPEQMEMTGQLVREHPDCHIQTHLSENKDEIAFTLSLYPQARDYLDIYETYGLLSDKLLLGHSIHLEPREIARMAETGSRAVFCPTSNLFLGSGLFDEAGLRAAGVVSGIATDVGGGTSYSMLQTLNEGYKILQLRGQKLHPYAAFHWVTRGNALALGMADRIGTLDPGSDADLVVLDSRATPAMALRMDRAETLAEELFILQILGDDRAIAQTYVAGKPMLG
ncbi:guanine deaminase [Paracoccus sp. PS-1]|uniref:guanine deaminase n=1 Tax=unclassified Paracoccus (in: a-proteobacteria) TaxID=2688777 RepID=UPI00048EB157|nr:MULTISPECIES: guanine deaminase [unclassified Paracoccus (in: a-proteobacteria)]MDQ7261116.1 guanine deaminase [Paracoccus sp. PS1]